MRKHDGMPPWIPRVIVLVVLAFLGTYLLVWSVIRLRSFLLALLLSLFASFALEPGVDFLARRGWRRGLATSVVFAVVVVAGVVFARSPSRRWWRRAPPWYPTSPAG